MRLSIRGHYNLSLLQASSEMTNPASVLIDQVAQERNNRAGLAANDERIVVALSWYVVG